MKCLNSLAELKSFRSALDGTVGFVPTMGALHQGHLSLVERSLAESDHTLVSIYVNPTQFNNASDLENYPSTLEEDLASLAGKADGVFLPTFGLLYPDDFAYRLDETGFSNQLCGENRPGHFTGVLTVVMKLLNLMKPDRAYFGEKDYQQLKLVRGMAETFSLRLKLLDVPSFASQTGWP